MANTLSAHYLLTICSLSAHYWLIQLWVTMSNSWNFDSLSDCGAELEDVIEKQTTSLDVKAAKVQIKLLRERLSVTRVLTV